MKAAHHMFLNLIITYFMTFRGENICINRYNTEADIYHTNQYNKSSIKSASGMLNASKATSCAKKKIDEKFLPRLKSTSKYESFVEYKDGHKRDEKMFISNKQEVKSLLNAKDRSDIALFKKAIEKCNLFNAINSQTFHNEIVYFCLKTCTTKKEPQNRSNELEETDVTHAQAIYARIRRETNGITSFFRYAYNAVKSTILNLFNIENSYESIAKTTAPDIYQETAFLYVKTCNVINDIMKTQMFNTYICIIMKRLPNFIMYVHENPEHRCVRNFLQWYFRQNFKSINETGNVHLEFYNSVIYDFYNNIESVDLEALIISMVEESDSINAEIYKLYANIKESLDRNTNFEIQRKKVLQQYNDSLLQTLPKDAIVPETIQDDSSIQPDIPIINVITEPNNTVVKLDANVKAIEKINVMSDKTSDKKSSTLKKYEELCDKLEECEKHRPNINYNDLEIELKNLLYLSVSFYEGLQKARKKNKEDYDYDCDFQDKRIYRLMKELLSRPDRQVNLFNAFIEMHVMNTEKEQIFLEALDLCDNNEERKQVIKEILKFIFLDNDYLQNVLTVATMQSECKNIETKHVFMMKDLLKTRYLSLRKKLLVKIDFIRNRIIRDACYEYLKLDKYSLVELISDPKYQVFEQTYNNMLICFTRGQLILVYGFYVLFRQK